MVKEGTDRKEGPIYHRISRQEAEKLEDLYYTYEFSDKFRILSEPGNFATIFNLAKAGILTWEETFEILLGL